ncbi:sigma factor [Actinomadura welshii]|uniref:sigma factor n=1 Tax=Actinomadura welshii TaxID=3103817 RepID=UPI00040564DC|nr:sigma factor [Actinomadura madurae]
MPRYRIHCGGGSWDEYGRRFTQAALPHLDEIYSVALRMTGERAEAEEIVLETYTQAFYSFGQRPLYEPLETWLYAILLQVVAEAPLLSPIRPVERGTRISGPLEAGEEMSTTDKHKRERLRDIEVDLDRLRRDLIPPTGDAHDYIDSAQDLNAREEIGGMIETLESERERLRAQLGPSEA